ncbi:MAG TPA: hypothetical protein VLB44_01105, partial [Kofleriaceae bacterium]|nr:hypothetical protein [Kofleriaceae bacterium]
PTTDAHRKAIGALYKKLVFEHPIAFLRHRLGVQIAQLKTGVAVWYGFTNAEWGENLLHHRSVHSAIQLWWVLEMVDLTHKRVFRPHMYFMLSLLFLLMCRRQKLAFMILASGVAHEAGLFLIAPAVDYRYNQWMVLCAIMGGIILFVRRKRGESDADLSVERTA